MKNRINVIDMFCGAGGLSLGFENEKFNTLLAIDLWDTAIKTFNHNRKNKVGFVEDINNIDEKYIKDKIGNTKVNGIIGGPPCQGFSLAGKRSVDDIRNQLYKQYFRVLSIINPDFFVIENVTGILNLDNGNFKNDIIKKAKDIGYNIHYKTLIASDYGVPQNRQRVFFIGIKSNLDKGNYEFPKPEDNKITCREALSDLPLLGNKLKEESYICDPQNDYQKLMRKDCEFVMNHENSKHTEETKKLISMIPEGGSIKDLPDKYKGSRVYSSLLRRMDSSKPSNTIDTGHRTYFHFKENRVISVREAARLQSFPDSYEFLGGKQSQYKQVGNAVPPILAKKVAKSIYNYLYR